MAGIPVHTASPISTNASKATAITPSTQPADTTGRGPAHAPATTTATSSNYPPARPGAAPVPAPTGTPSAFGFGPSPTQAAEATQTSNAPPPPQPGAVPTPFVAAPSPITNTRGSSIPPPPKAGEIPRPAAYYVPHSGQEAQPQQSPYSPQTQMPPQMSAVLSTPSRAIPPSSTTSTPAYADLSHPPGYIQNSRDSFDARPDGHSAYQNSYGNNSSHRGGLLGGTGTTGDEVESPLAQAWKTASSWAKTAGEKLKEGEEEVWRRINNDK